MDIESRDNILVLLNIMNIVSVLKLKNKKKSKNLRKMWARNWLLNRGTGRDVSHLVLKELRMEDVRCFQNYTRMKTDTFNYLLNVVTPFIKKQDTILRESIPASTRLLLTMRFLATGDSYSDLSFNFRISIPSISIIILETLKAIYTSLKDDYLKMPNCKEQWKEVANQFQNQWNFPNCLGALDGKHIAFRAKKSEGSYYFNYKGFNSIILLALVDANYCFMYVDVGCNGRVHDAGVYANSTLCKGISQNLFDFPDDAVMPKSSDPEPFPYVIIGDDAFRLTTRMIKPYSQRSSNEKKVFNYRLSRARRVVENAFGILANKFQILQKEINLSVEKVELITLTCCVLHNYISQHDGKQYAEEVATENTTNVTLTPARWGDDIFITRLETSLGNRSADSALQLRDRFCRYFNTEGFVPWQWEAIKKFNF